MERRVLRLAARTVQEMKKEILYGLAKTRPRKLLFDHLPKCGGTSLIAYLKIHYPLRRTFSINGRNPKASVNEFKNLSRAERYGYDLIVGHLAHELIGSAHPDCLKVTVLREPIDRIISHYHYASRTPEHYLYSTIHETGMSLEDYVSSGLSGELRNWYTTHFSGLTVEEAESNTEEAISTAMEVVLRNYDIVGFLDNFACFAETLRRQAKLRYEYANNKLNATIARVSAEDVPTSAIDVIEKMNHLDIVLYRRVRAATGQ